MHIFPKAFWLPKRGNSDAEYEDAFWPIKSVDSKQSIFRFAVADGATETSFAAHWAQLLVRGYCKAKLSKEPMLRALAPLRARWLAGIRDVSLPWYAEQKASEGAYSSILGLTLLDGLSSGHNGRWNALSVGDSCMFQIRDEKLISSFPKSFSTDFNSRPALLSSVAHLDQDIPATELAHGDCQDGDTFYLMTDAIACWFLTDFEKSGQPWQIIRDLDTGGERATFAEWIEKLRDTHEIRNDDVTMIRIEII